MPEFLAICRFVFAAAMLLLPGYLAARLCRVRARWALAYPLSSVILFCVIFWIHASGFYLNFGAIAWAELIICAGLAIAIKKSRPVSIEPVELSVWHTADKCLIGFAAIMVALLIWRSLMAPLAGFDTYFRWNFLAQQILRYGRYDFYPPIKPADFQKYFYVDAIPPLVPFTYWWLYVAIGASWAKITVIPVALQYISCLAIVYHIARHLAGNRAGTLAAAALASSSLFFRDVAIAQESGLTALAMAGLLYSLCVYRQTTGGCIITGAMVALAAMSREYGCAFIVIGCVALTGRPWWRITLLCLVAFLLIGPWYMRTWLLTGNPFYSVPFFKANVNPVIGSLLKYCRQTLGITNWTAGAWCSMLAYFLEASILQWTVGLFGLFMLVRREKNRNTLTLCTATILVIALWLYAVGNSGGGPWYSTRVLSPALVALSITVALALARIPFPLLTGAIGVYAILCALVTAWIYPAEISSLPSQKWMAFGASPWLHTQPSESVGSYLSQARFPHSQQILSPDAYLYVGLLPAGYTVTPPWRPDLQFLFDPKITAEEDCKRLIAMHITAVEFDPGAFNTIFLDSISNFFHQLYHDPHGYQPLVRIGDGGILLLPK
jgi:hypothetical protein